MLTNLSPGLRVSIVVPLPGGDVGMYDEHLKVHSIKPNGKIILKTVKPHEPTKEDGDGGL